MCPNPLNLDRGYMQELRNMRDIHVEGIYASILTKITSLQFILIFNITYLNIIIMYSQPCISHISWDRRNSFDLDKLKGK